MSRFSELETREALAALSVPETGSLTRRRFLAASAATAGATALLPSWLADAAEAATPIGANDGVLVVVLMGGGNDGLNMVPPVGSGAYRDLRRSIAIAEADALPLVAGHGLHPQLTRLHARYEQGQVAVVQGVGDVKPDLSHFTAMARWMCGHQQNDATTSGWLGRWLDGFAKADDFSAVAIGESVPLALVGTARRATALPATGGGAISGKPSERWVQRSLDCLRDLGAGPTGNGAWADALGAATRDAVELSDTLAPIYGPELPGGRLAPKLELAARLVNADLGIRVIQVSYGDFDHHAGLAWQHAARMTELDEGIEQFFATLSPTFAKRTTLMTMSEFGRRPRVNGSNGTDHGQASDLFVVGAGVKGGRYGAPVDLTRLAANGCPNPTVDYRSVYATILDRWLGNASIDVLGGRFEDLGFLRTPAR